MNINSRNDVVQAISNCPPIAIRQLLLRHTRAVRLSRTWNSPDWPSCALPFVLRCSFGDELVLDDDNDVTLKYCQVRRRAFYAPIEASLRQRTNGTVSRGLLRWLLNAPLTPGVFRTLLLWILGKWRQFTPKPCMKCQEPFTRQMHVITCSSLPFRLEECSTLPPNVPVPLVEFVVESYINHVRTSFDPDAVSQVLADLVDTIRMALAEIFPA
jgi:hypothetical protein